jgi:hypothetical protein
MSERWEKLRNSHKGETCLVIGNGPSLKDMPLRFLKSYPSFGSNRIYLLKGFTPTYYVAVNDLVILQSLDEIRKIKSEALFVKDTFPMLDEWYPLHSRLNHGFGLEPEFGIYEGYTVTFVSLQLAYFMGFQIVLLAGVDHKYQYPGNPNEETKARELDANHFDPHYFGPGTVWNNPDLKMSEEAYASAAVTFEKAGREIINITPGSALNVFDKQDWKNWWKNG